MTAQLASEALESPRMRRGTAHIVMGMIVGVLISGWSGAFRGAPAPNTARDARLDERPGAGVEVGAAEDVALALDVPWLPGTVARWAPEMRAAAARHGVDPDLLAIVVLVESGGYSGALSPSGAVGLMQVMPATARDIAAQRGLADFEDADLADPATNLDFGAWYLASQLRSFGQRDDPDWARSVSLAAAAYNGGPGRLQAHLAGQGLGAETVQYQDWISGMWAERRSTSSDTYDRWVRAGGWRLLAAAAASAAL